jgi:hypothetical protein
MRVLWIEVFTSGEYNKSYFVYRRLSAKTLSVEFTKPFNSLAEMKKAAPSAAIFSTQTRGWWTLLEKVRTHFDENPS